MVLEILLHQVLVLLHLLLAEVFLNHQPEKFLFMFFQMVLLPEIHLFSLNLVLLPQLAPSQLD